MKKILSVFLIFGIVLSSVNAFCFAENKKVFAKQEINIAMATDDNYVYPTLVAISSILEHSKENEVYNFYVLLSGNVQKNSKENILSLQNKYRNCKLNLIEMNDYSSKCKTSGHITMAAYHRLKLPSLLPKLDKILYLDVDIIANKNISDLYNINIDNYYAAGVDHPRCSDIGMGRRFLISTGIKDSPIYVNSGILLMNLKKMRENSIEKAFSECIEENRSNGCWRQHDQDIINKVLNGKILLIPLKYNAMQHFYGRYEDLKTPIAKEIWDEAYTDPVIIHYSSHVKPWNDKSLPNANIWWSYAMRTSFFNEIKDKFLE